MDGEDRDFFKKIKNAAFANPFSEERELTDLEISGLDTTRSNQEILNKLSAKIFVRIEKYKDKVRKLNRDELSLYRYGVLFYLFHLFSDKYDQLITEQVAAGEKSVAVSFAEDALRQFEAYGYNRQEGLKFFSLFFQLRRGFFFINAIIGKSPCVRALREALWNNIFTCDVKLYENYLWNRMEDFSTILLGETGTGKGMAAAAIGRSGYIPFDEKKGCLSESFGRSFISINLSQFSEYLVESELFGHAKGSFTGAINDHHGIFYRCSSHGAIFLDEIGDVSVALQIKLLQVIQERTFAPVGSHETQRFHGRVIAATNQPLSVLRRKGKFRDDFYYRLCSDTIELPPLRQRLDENPGELEEILSMMVTRIVGFESIPLVGQMSVQIQKTIPADYGWPGNIRELEQCVRQMLLKRSYCWQECKDDQQQLDEFQKKYTQGDFTAAGLLAAYCGHLYDQNGTYEKVAKITGLDRRTVKKHIDLANTLKDDG